MNALPRSTVRRASAYVGEAAAAVAFLYFVVGGASWPPTMWAAFCVFAVAVVVAQVLYDVGHLGEPEHSLWRLGFGFAMVAGLLGAAVYAWSLWGLALGVVLGWFWHDDWRTHRKLARLRSQMGHRDAAGKSGDR